MESKLPLNIPHLLKIMFPEGAGYVLHGRKYEDIEWQDAVVSKPSLEDLEILHNRLESHQKTHESWVKHSVNAAHKDAHKLKSEALDAAAPEVQEILKKAEIEAELLRKELLKAKADEAASGIIKEADMCWEQVDPSMQKQREESLSHLHETDWYVLRAMERECHGGKPVPEEIKISRAAARDALQKSDVVYLHWQKLREAHYPSKSEMAEALRSGSMEAIKMLVELKRVNEKFKRPLRVEDWRKLK